MKNRKWIAALVSAVLAIGVAGTAFAAETVPGAVYGHDRNENVDRQEVQQVFQRSGVRDVPPTHYAAGSIALLVESGLMHPNAGGNLNPDEGTTVDSATAVFAKVLGIANKTDDDATAARKAEKAGLLSNRTDIQRDMTRLETARLLGKALGIKPKKGVTAANFPFTDQGQALSDDDMALLAALYDAGVFKGFEDRSFRPNNVLTKAQIAILVDRILGSKK